MKKLITSMFLLALFGFGSAIAGEVYFEETFATQSMGAWKSVDVDQKVISSETKSTLSKLGIVAQTTFGWDIGRFASNPVNYAAISTSYYTPADTANDWLISPEIQIGEDAVLEWQAYALSSDYPDGYKVYISTTGDDVADFTQEIFSIDEENGYFTRRYVDLSKLGFKNQKIRIAFRNVSADKFLLAIDDIKVWVPNDYDLAAVQVNFEQYYKTSLEGITLSFFIQNLGYKNITSFDINYQADGEEVVTATVQNPTIGYLAYSLVNHPTKWKPSVLKERSIKVWISNINGSETNDFDLTNDTTSGTTYVWNNTIAKNIFPLYESFTSATCYPCKQINTYMNPLLKNNKESVAVVKYQMNFPGTIGDIYYTAEGGVRKTYYGVNAVPMAFGNGISYPFNQNTVSQAGINKLKVFPGFYEISNAAYVINGRKVKVEANIKALDDFSAGNIVAHVAVIELTTYNNKATNGETEFYNVMKKMLPNSNGTIVTALEKDATQQLWFSYEFPENSTVEEYDDLAVVIWVQNNTNKNVLDAAYAVKSTVLDVPYTEDGNGIVAVFPNPSSDIARMRYAIKGDQSVSIELYSIDGNLIYGNDYGVQSEGYYIENFDISNLASGQYIIKLSIGDKVFSDKINVVR